VPAGFSRSQCEAWREQIEPWVQHQRLRQTVSTLLICFNGAALN
jgi:hypothetical protein